MSNPSDELKAERFNGPSSPTVYGHNIGFGEALGTWVRIALLSFGGPAGQIAVMHRTLVEEKHWIGETRFLHALNYCMLLPGPEAHQLVVYIGWLLHRTWGGIVAGTLFVLPGLISLGVLSWIYARFGNFGFVQALFFGLKAAVLAVVLEAVVRIGKRALKNRGLTAIAAAAFAGIFFFALPFPVIIAAAAVIGFVGHRAGLRWFEEPLGHASESGPANENSIIDEAFRQRVPDHVRPSVARFIATAAIGLILWLGPLALLAMAAGTDNVFTAIAAFNSKMAVVTFGGAYAALSYMAQQAVENYRWLQADEMLVGLGFAETTPGPLISVVQFIGFMAAFRNPGALDPVLAGTLGGLLAMWSTFVPSFLWILLGGPYVESLLGKKALTAALSAITAAVVGVILNLAIWFALHTLFQRVDVVPFYGMTLQVPDASTINLPALVLSLGAIIAMFRFKAGMMATLGTCCVLGLAFYFLNGLH